MKRVLLVDDESGFTRLLKLTLERTGKYVVREENDGARAWLAAREFRPDIVFLDILMPKIDGGDVAAKLRGDPTLAGVAIVFLSAIVSRRESGGEIGGIPCLSKPVSLDDVVACIERHTGGAS